MVSVIDNNMSTIPTTISPSTSVLSVYSAPHDLYPHPPRIPIYTVVQLQCLLVDRSVESGFDLPVVGSLDAPTFIEVAFSARKDVSIFPAHTIPLK